MPCVRKPGVAGTPYTKHVVAKNMTNVILKTCMMRCKSSVQYEMGETALA
jgi:hypothetical protein